MIPAMTRALIALALALSCGNVWKGMERPLCSEECR